MTPAWIGVLLALAGLLASSERLAKPLLVGVVALQLVSAVHNATLDAVWTMGTSTSLPAVAEHINGADAPLVVGDNERHNPGNLMALSAVLRDDAHMQFITWGDVDGYALPEGHGAFFLFSPLPQLVERLQGQGFEVVELERDLHLSLWRVR